MNAAIRSLLALSLVTFVVGQAAWAKPVVVPGKWLVELESPPAVAYEGEPVAALQADGAKTSARPPAATAPEATGRHRYDAHAPEVVAYTAHLGHERAQVLELASQALGRPVAARRVYEHVFNGFEARLSAEEAARLADLPGVRSVQPVVAHRLELDAGPELIGATRVHAGVPGIGRNGGEGTVIGIIDSGINWDHLYFSDAPLPSGHRFTNPYGSQLGECSRPEVKCNNKLVGVYDFTVEGTHGKDPQGHGTHVASIAAGVPLTFTLGSTGSYQYRTTGVAPHANIISYKVCYKEHPSNSDLDNRCENTAILQAWDQAVVDGVDVVNYSIGSDPDDPWSTGSASVRLLNLWSAGIPFVTSAGNAGPDLGTIGAPANAPWAFAVGNSTHGRISGSQATVAGLANRLLVYGTGPGLTAEITAPLVAADDFGDDDLACGAFPGGALAGDIVLIQRGGCNFSVKVNHAAAAGAVAVLAYNNVAGPPIRMGGLEGTTIPAAMMSKGDGEAVRRAMSRTDNPTATLMTGGFAKKDSRLQDYISDSSARGPVAYSGVMKPNVVAPGSNILAGWYDGPNAVAFASGTSMASPHAAGAVALLKSIHPGWTPAMLQSVLETTTETQPLKWDGDSASVLDRGSGRIRVDLAARAGLYLPVTRSDFMRANPATGGDPARLNLAGLWNDSCDRTCSFTRTVKAIDGGRWTVSTGGNVDISVRPASFELRAGQTRQLTIEVDTGSRFAGALGEGHIEFVPEQGDFVSQRLQVGVRVPGIDLPRPLELGVDRNRGRQAKTVISGPLPEPVFRTSELVVPTRESFTLWQDSRPDDPYSGGSGARTFLVDVPEDALMLMAEVVSSSARDIDLFVGRDSNGNGRADESEEVCRSTSPQELETCFVESPQAGTWWVLVQNWKSSRLGAQDEVELDLAVLTASDDYGFVASGPGFHPGGEFEMVFSWDEPAMLKNQRRVAAVGLSTSPDALEDLGVVPVHVIRRGDNQPEPTALFAGETRAVVVPGNTAHDLLFVDVPPSATGLKVAIKGQSGVNGALYRIGHDDIAGFAPGTPPAPTSGALATGSGSGAGYTLVQSAGAGATLPAGRYYIVLDNTAGSERRVNVTVSIEESAAAQLPRFGLWSPLGRSIYQGFEWNAGAAGLVVWYSYDENGLPVFYNAVEAIDARRSTWSTQLLRTTSIGVRNNIDTVGYLGITALAPDDMIVAWRRDGAHGSERLQPDHSRSCPRVGGELKSYTGHWFAPGIAQGGTTMIVTDSSQAQVRYYFDQLGVGRWVITSDNAGAGPLAEQLDVLELRGFCPNCDQRPVTIETVGSYSRVFDDQDHATEIIEFRSRPPLKQSYSSELAIERLTARLECL